MDEKVQIATVVWYNEKKGYGFVTIGVSEIFLHCSALERFGLSTVYATDKLHLTVTSNQRGDVVKEIMSIERAKSDTIPSDSEPLEDEVRGPQASGIRLRILMIRNLISKDSLINKFFRTKNYH